MAEAEPKESRIRAWFDREEKRLEKEIGEARQLVHGLRGQKGTVDNALREAEDHLRHLRGAHEQHMRMKERTEEEDAPAPAPEKTPEPAPAPAPAADAAPEPAPAPEGEQGA